MRIIVEEARRLVERVMIANDLSGEDARIVAEHIIDCELRGLDYGGLARVVSIVERLRRTGPPRGAIEVRHETPVSARLDGAHLNDLDYFRDDGSGKPRQPSVENLAEHMNTILLEAIRGAGSDVGRISESRMQLWESDTAWAGHSLRPGAAEADL